MHWRARRRCAWTVILLGLVGCTVPEVLQVSYWQQGQTGAEAGTTPMVAGSVAVVTQNTQTVLSRLGVATVSSTEGDRVVLRCTTSKGTRFKLLLEGSPIPGDGIHTRLQFAWEGKADDELRSQVMTGLLALNTAGKLAR